MTNARRTFGIVYFAAGLAVAPTSSALAQTHYTPDWASLDTHTAAPEWFKDSKFGIYFHWGAFGTAEFEYEWYPRLMYKKDDPAYAHHINVYGDPFTNWGYDKFITGGKDKNGNFVQFAPKLVTAGGKWDPDAWAKVIVDAGARFAGPVAEHHDGFSMWDSKVNPWNSAAKGPMLNLAKLHADAYRKRGLKFIMTMHHAWHFTGYYDSVPSQSDPMLKTLFGQQDGAVEQQLWQDKLTEIIDEFQPDILWHDVGLWAIDESRRLEFLAHYYNSAVSWNKEVIVTYKDGFNNKGEMYDFERGGPADLLSPYWLSDEKVSAGENWCYVQGMTCFTKTQLIHRLVDLVSKNGNLLLNISPKVDGTIPQDQLDILSAFGTFLKQMGTAIYNTRAWKVYGEGPTKMGGGSFVSPVEGTAADVRYTASKDGDAVYAILLGWPGNGKQVTLASVTTSRLAVGNGKVFLFGPTGGSPITLPFTQDGSGLHITLPSTQPYTAIAYAMKISKSGTEPELTPWLTDGNNLDGGVGDGGGVAAEAGAGGSGGAAGHDDAGGVGDASASSRGSSTSGSGGARASGGAGGGASSSSGGMSSGCSCSVETAGTAGASEALFGLGLATVSLVRARRRRADAASKLST